MTINKKFNKPPLSPLEKEKKAEEFISFVENNQQFSKETNLLERKLKKETVKSLFLRIPQSLHLDLQEIVALTGISLNSACLELLRPTIKKKLKELKDLD